MPWYQIKSPLQTPGCHFKIPVWVSTAALLIQLPNTPGNAVEDGPRTWAPATNVRPGRNCRFLPWSGPTPAMVAIWWGNEKMKISLYLSLCLSPCFLSHSFCHPAFQIHIYYKRIAYKLNFCVLILNTIKSELWRNGLKQKPNVMSVHLYSTLWFTNNLYTLSYLTTKWSWTFIRNLY